MGILGSAVAELVEKRAVTGAALEKFLINGGLSGSTAAGVAVDQNSALSSTAIFQGLRILSGGVSMVPLGVFRRLDPGREVLRSHPTHLVLQEPNPEITAIELRQIVTSFAASAGNGYAQIVFDNAGAVRELWPIPPHRIAPERSPSGSLRYRVRTTDGQDRFLPMEEVLHLRGFTRGGLLGVDAIAKMQNAVGLTLAADQFSAAFFANGSFLSGFIRSQTKLQKESVKNIRDSFEQEHRGPTKAHRIGFLEEAMEWIPAGADPKASQLIEQRRFSIEDVSRILNVPLHLLNHLERMTFNNIEELGISFVVYSLGEWYVRWEQTIAKRLLRPSERAAGLYAKHNPAGLLRGNHAARAAFYKSLHEMGVLSADDIRELEDMNPLPDGIGARYFVRRDTWPLDQIDELVAGESTAPALPPASEPEEEDDRAEALRLEKRAAMERRATANRRGLRSSFTPLFEDAASSAVKKETVALRGAMKKAFGGRDAGRLREEIDRFYGDFAEWLAERFMPVLTAYARQVANDAASEVDGEPPADLDAFVATYAEKFADRWVGSSAGQMRALIRDTEADALEEEIETRLAEWEEKRPAKVAQREVVESGEAVVLVAFAAASVITVTWRTVGENCPFCNHLNGRTVRISEPFVRPLQTIDPGGDTTPLFVRGTIAHPPLHGGCDCLLLPG